MKVLIAHPAQQHSYKLAAALKKAGMLYGYATTVYYKKGSLTSLVTKLLKGKFRAKGENRHCVDLEDGEVIQFCECEGLIKLLALNTRLFKKKYNFFKYHTADRFAKKVAKYAIKNNVDAVVTYDDSSPLLFEILKKEAPNILRILDMSSASLLYLKEIYEDDMKKSPDFAERMLNERSICWDPDILDRSKREIESSQMFLVPSNFVARSLQFSGIDIDRMYRCPYGVDVGEFSPIETRMNNRTLPIKFVYVGGVKELKGISYLLKAFSKISPDIAQLTVIGNYNKDDKDIEPYKDHVIFTGNILHGLVAEELRRSDVFVFASLGDGLSLAALEAAACGLPLIVTENTGVIDELTDGVEGFVIPIQDIDAITDKVLWFVEHPDMISTMGEQARAFALKFTWDNYYHRIADIFRSMENIDESNTTR